MEDKIFSQPDELRDNTVEIKKEGEEPNKEKLAEAKELEKKLREYEDLEGLSTKKLNLGLWYAERAIKIRRLINITLILVSFASWSFTLYNYGHYYLFGKAADERIMAELTEPNLVSHTYFLNKASQNLVLSNISAIRASEGKYDLYTKIQNTNASYWAEFDYCFVSEGIDLECDRGFILPKETKYVMALAKEMPGDARGAIFNIKDIIWRRINPHVIYDWDEYENEHLDIVISEISFVPPQASGLSEKLNLAVLNFSAANNTPYNYWETAFNIVVYRGNAVVGVNRYTLEEFMSGEERDVTISWPSDVQQASGIDIEVDLNIMNENNYIKPSGGTGEEK